MNDFSVHRIIGRGGFGEVYGCRKADTGKMYAMKCLDKKRIKMKQGETLALNERIMLSLVSTGVSVFFFFVRMKIPLQIISDNSETWNIVAAGRLPIHSVHDVRLSYGRQAMLHPGSDERRRFALPLKSTRCLQRTGNEVLCRGGDPRLRTHAPQVYCLPWSETREYIAGRARSRQDIGSGTGMRFLEEETARERVCILCWSTIKLFDAYNASL